MQIGYCGGCVVDVNLQLKKVEGGVEDMAFLGTVRFKLLVVVLACN